RRFVTFYFDLATGGAAGDKDARAFVVKMKSELSEGAIPPPDVIFATPDGKLVGSVGNYADADEVWEAMKAALKEHPEFNAESQAEKDAETPREKAEIAFDLGKFKTAAGLLADPQNEEDWL